MTWKTLMPLLFPSLAELLWLHPLLIASCPAVIHMTAGHKYKKHPAYVWSELSQTIAYPEHSG